MKYIKYWFETLAEDLEFRNNFVALCYTKLSTICEYRNKPILSPFNLTHVAFNPLKIGGLNLSILAGGEQRLKAPPFLEKNLTVKV